MATQQLGPTPTQPADAATKDYVDQLMAALVPPGTLIPFAGGAIPPGWITCRGQALERAAFPALFASLGTRYGSSTATDFFLPNLSGKVIAGTNANDSDFTLGNTIGTKDVTLTQAQMPVHTHIQNSHSHVQDAHAHTQQAHSHSQSNHTHTVNHGHSGILVNGNAQVSLASVASGSGAFGLQVGSAGSPLSTSSDNMSTSGAVAALQTVAPVILGTTATNQAFTATNQNAGGGDAHSNVQPTFVLNYLIKS